MGEQNDTARDGEAPILTPDQRVRVFVSSTMEELAAERTAVRGAVEALHLAPVLFELGARSHPPRSLYRSYLHQSHVFLGIYWQRYGWIAPGMDVSGLEDEYLLSGALPKLVYVKRPAPDRESRLSDLLDGIRDSDEVAYKSFGTADELRALVADDLAQLLTEAFLVGPGDQPHRVAATTPLPADTTTFVGREAELAELRARFDRDDVRLVTLTGPGGIGKTRLALRFARQLAPAFDEGAAFVQLGALRDPRMVAPAIATAVGVAGGGAAALADVLAADLAERSLLLVVDNCEQVMAATDLFPDLLAAAPRLKILATSREALRLRGEYEFEVPPLEAADGMRLFDERAGAVRRDFRIDDTNEKTIAAICRRLDGLPLAIELAAAQARLLPPKTMLERLDRRLDFLVGGARDSPERQRAMRTTLQWSYDLLDAAEQRLFAHLAAFAGSFSLAAAESVCAEDGDVLELLASLVDKSLLRAEATADEPRFRMLEMIREFATEQLDESAEAEEVRERHAAFYRDRGLEIGAGLRCTNQPKWLEVLGRDGEGEGDNLRAALAWLLARGRLDEFTDMAWALWVGAWINGLLDEGRRLIGAALSADGPVDDLSRARLLTMAGLFGLWTGEHGQAAGALEEARTLSRMLGDDEVVAYAAVAESMLVAPQDGEARAEEVVTEGLALCRRIGDAWGEALALNALGWLRVAQDRIEESRSIFEETLASARAVGDENVMAMAEVNLAEYHLELGDTGAATELLASSAARHRALRLLYSVAYMLDGAARLAHRRGDDTRAAQLLGAATHRRDAIGVAVWGSQLERRNRLIDEVRSALGADAFTREAGRGAEMTFADAVDAAVPGN